MYGGSHLYAAAGDAAGIEQVTDQTPVTITYEKGLLPTTAISGRIQASQGDEVVKGVLPTTAPGLPQTETAAAGSVITVTNQGVSVPGYVLIGWNTLPRPVVYSLASEIITKAAPTFYGMGAQLTVPDTDLTLYAVWAIDKDNNGAADYRKNESIAIPNYAGLRSGKLASADDEVSLRSSHLPGWDAAFDIPMERDRIYFPGCIYNADPDNGLQDLLFHSDQWFNSAGMRPLQPMKLVIEYGGVLPDRSLIGGKDQQPLDTIEITNDMVISQIPLEALLDRYPFRFDSIKAEGEAILKMHFIEFMPTPLGYVHPPTTPAYWEIVGRPGLFPPGISAPFMNPETGLWTADTFVVRFNFYNEAVFESDILSQKTEPYDSIRYKHVSGLPLEYMMRSINGLGWQPALAPLTEMEKLAVNDGVSVSLREMEKTLGRQGWLKEYYLSDAYSYDDPYNGRYAAKAYMRAYNVYYEEIWNELYASAPPAVWAAFQTQYTSDYSLYAPALLAAGGTAEDARGTIIEFMCMMGESGVFPFYPDVRPYTSYTSNSDATDIIQENARTIYWPQVQQERADLVYVPDPCRAVHQFTFEKLLMPEVERYVKIRSIPGVTSVPEANKEHYIRSRDDFAFTLTFSGGNPLKVMATGYYSKRVEELPPTALGNGRYSYLIRRITEPWTVDILNELASGVGNDLSFAAASRIWSYGGTLYIESSAACRASVYTVSGALARQLDVAPGQTRLPLERGLYIIELNGVHHKVAVK